MKNLILSSLVLGASLVSFTLINSVQKEVKLIDDSKLIYNVNEKNELHGAYSVLNTKETVTIRGSYTDNKRTGNWYCFNNDKSMFLRYNYDQKKILFIDTVAIKKAEIVIVDKNPEAVKNSSISVPVCPIDQYLSIMKKEITESFPPPHMEYTGPTQIEIVAKVDANGQAKYQANYIFDKIKRSISISGKNKAFTIDWIPAMYDGKGIASEFKVATEVSFSNADGHKRFNWN